MRIKSKNKYFIRIVAWLFKLPIHKINFVYYKEVCDPEVSERTFLRQNRIEFEHQANEFLKDIDEELAKTQEK